MDRVAVQTLRYSPQLIFYGSFFSPCFSDAGCYRISLKFENDQNSSIYSAGEKTYTDILEEHRQWIPEDYLPPASNGAYRIRTCENGMVNWQGEDIPSGDPIPENTRQPRGRKVAKKNRRGPSFSGV
jgi:hypothetical protein